MKPYSPKPNGNQKGHTSLTSKSPTRSRSIKRDKVAARQDGKRRAIMVDWDARCL